MAGGRPSPIDRNVGTRDDGTPITVADRIISAVEAGTPIRIAAAESGITNDTYCEWVRVGARARLRTGNDDTDPTITAHERRCIEFSDQVQAARARWAINHNRLLERDAREGRTKTKTVEELDPQTGQVLSRTTTTERLPADNATMRWRLKCNYPDEYAERLELTGREGGPIDVDLTLAERASALTDLVRKVRAASKPSKARTVDGGDVEVEPDSPPKASASPPKRKPRAKRAPQ